MMNSFTVSSPYPIDLYQGHQPCSLSSEHEEMHAMAKLWKRKLIRNIGWRKFNPLFKPAGLARRGISSELCSSEKSIP